MTNKTLIIDGSNPDKERAFQTKVLQQETFQQDLVEVAQHEKKKFSNLKIAGGVLAAGAAVLAFMSFTPAPDSVLDNAENAAIPLPDEPEMATKVTDSMSFSDAFEVAREELGAGGYFVWHDKLYGTYYKEEWNQLTPEEQNEFYNNTVEVNGGIPDSGEPVTEPVVTYDHAPESIFVTDDMSFNDAFAVAREEVGSGGVFEWNGKVYSTYTKEEWQSMDQEDHLAFQNSVDHTTIQENNIVYEHDGIMANNTINVSDVSSAPTGEVFLGEQMVDIGDGQMVTVGLFDNNGVQEIRIDADNNGTYEYLYNPDNESIANVQSGETFTIDSNQSLADNSQTPLGTEEVMIDGHQAWVTTFANGRIEANVDVDGDGVADSLVQLDQSGNMQLYDNEGNMLHQEQIDMTDHYQDADLTPSDSGMGYFAMDDSNSTNHDYNSEEVRANEGYETEQQSDFYVSNDDFDHNMDGGFDNDAAVDDWT